MARFCGTIGGALIAKIVLNFINKITDVAWGGTAFAVINGLLKKTNLGMILLFYTAAFLLLYGANDLSSSGLVTSEKLFYDLIGISVGLIVTVYPFPIFMKKINPI